MNPVSRSGVMTARRRPGPTDRPLPFPTTLTALSVAAVLTPAEAAALLTTTTGKTGGVR